MKPRIRKRHRPLSGKPWRIEYAGLTRSYDTWLEALAAAERACRRHHEGLR